MILKSADALRARSASCHGIHVQVSRLLPASQVPFKTGDTVEGGLAVGRAGKGTPQSPEAESGHTPIDGPLEQAWTPQPPRPLCPAFQPPPPRLGTNSRHLSVSPAAHPHHCGMGSSPAGRRIAAAKSKVPETRRSSVGSRFAPTAILPRGRGLSQPSGRGLSPPRVGTANPVFDDFSFRLTACCGIASFSDPRVRSRRLRSRPVMARSGGRSRARGLGDRHRAASRARTAMDSRPPSALGCRSR